MLIKIKSCQVELYERNLIGQNIEEILEYHILVIAWNKAISIQNCSNKRSQTTLGNKKCTWSLQRNMQTYLHFSRHSQLSVEMFRGQQKHKPHCSFRGSSDDNPSFLSLQQAVSSSVIPLKANSTRCNTAVITSPRHGYRQSEKGN